MHDDQCPLAHRINLFHLMNLRFYEILQATKTRHAIHFGVVFAHRFGWLFELHSSSCRQHIVVWHLSVDSFCCCRNAVGFGLYHVFTLLFSLFATIWHDPHHFHKYLRFGLPFAICVRINPSTYMPWIMEMTQKEIIGSSIIIYTSKSFRFSDFLLVFFFFFVWTLYQCFDTCTLYI